MHTDKRIVLILCPYKYSITDKFAAIKKENTKTVA